MAEEKGLIMAQVWFFLENEDTDSWCMETDIIPRVGEHISYEFKPHYPEKYTEDDLVRAKKADGDYTVLRVAHRMKTVDIFNHKHYINVILKKV